MQKWMIAKEISIGLDQIHKAAFDSTGFGPAKDLPDRAGLDEDVLEVVDKCVPYYEQMHKERMKIDQLGIWNNEGFLPHKVKRSMCIAD